MPRRGLLLCALITIAIASGAAAGVAQAATLTVNTTLDSASPGPGMCSLREAVQEVDSPGGVAGGCAPAAFGPNTIVLGSGTYNLQAPNGELQLTREATGLTIVGAGESDTVINASGLGSRILEVQAGASVTIRSLTMTGGQAFAGASAPSPGSPAGAAAGQPGGNGGAIVNAGALTLIDAAITHSAAGRGGDGASELNGIIGDPGLPGGAGAPGGAGGAIFNTGYLVLAGATLADNQAGAGGNGGEGEQGRSSGGSGGAGGAAGNGGGVANDGGSVTIDSSTLRGNIAGAGGSGGQGGPYLNSEPSVGGTGGVGANGGWGGGVWSDGGELAVTNSTFVSNKGGDAGAGGAGGVGGGVGANAGTGGGGGAIALETGVGAKLLNMTAVDNGTGSGGLGGAGGTGSPSDGPPGADGQPGIGGGIVTAGGAPVAVQNSLLALNPGGNCAYGSVLDAGHDLSYGDFSCPSTFSSDDPKLGPLRDNGGPTSTVGLMPGSGAIDQIPPSGDCPAADQRGVPRPSGGGCDIGAYEVAPPVVLPGQVGVQGAHTVLITMFVTANAASAAVVAKYGQTVALGQQSSVMTVAGLTPTPVTIALTGLHLQSVYHYRIFAASSDGVAQSVEYTLAVPFLSGLRVVPGVFRPAGRGGPRPVLSYQDARAAVTTFAVQRHEGRRWVTVGKFGHRDRRGANRVGWNARLGRRRLGPGLYRLLATPRSHGMTGPTVGTVFKIT